VVHYPRLSVVRIGSQGIWGRTGFDTMTDAELCSGRHTYLAKHIQGDLYDPIAEAEAITADAAAADLLVTA
jgi:hypothetical protein